MKSKLMMAPNPRRDMKIDRVVVVGRSDDGSVSTVLSVDGIQNDDWTKRNFHRYFLSNAYWNFAALLLLASGVVLSVIWHWWIFLPVFILAGWTGYQGKVSGAGAGERILRENPSARDHFQKSGLLWDIPTKNVVET